MPTKMSRKIKQLVGHEIIEWNKSQFHLKNSLQTIFNNKSSFRRERK